PESVFLDELKALAPVGTDAALDEKWRRIIDVRSLVNDELDRQRKAGVLKSSQEAAVCLSPEKFPESQRALMKDPTIDWPFVLQMAEVALSGGGDAAVTMTATRFEKCERCWRHRADVGADAIHRTLCERCVSAVK